MNQPTDQVIITALQGCDPAGLEQIERYRKQGSLKFIYTHLKDWRNGKERRCSPTEADELWQEALIRVYEMFCVRKATLTCQLATLLNTIVRNVWSAGFRANSQVPPTEPDFEDPGSQVDMNALRQWARQRLEKMPEPCRTMLILRYYYSLDYDSIAGLMAYGGGDVVRNLISRCRRNFREQFPLNLDNIGDYDPGNDPNEPPNPNVPFQS